MGINVSTGTGGVLLDAVATPVRRDGRGGTHRVEDLLGAIPAAGSYPCMKCPTRLERPGICSVCAARDVAEELAAKVADRIRLEIPLLFRDVTWENILELRNEAGDPRVGLTRVQIEAVREALATSKRVVIVGAAGMGKSTIAIAWVRECIEQGAERARFVPSRNLLKDSRIDGLLVHELAFSASHLVVDDLGAELYGAPPGGGLASQRIDVVNKVLCDRFDAGQGYVVTTPHPREKLGEFYGDGLARRVYEGAAMIDLDKAWRERSKR